MSRAATDRRVRIVMATMARALASPHSKNIMQNVAGMILLGQPDLYDAPLWRAESMTPIVLAHVVGCPSRVLDTYVAAARSQLKWIEWWDSDGAEESGMTPTEIAAKHARRAA